VTTNLPELLDRMHGALTEMVRVTQKDHGPSLVKQGSEFTRDLSAAARLVTPVRGSIRSARLAALDAGGGIKIRPSVRASVAAKYKVATVRATTRGGRLIRSQSGPRFARGGKRLKLTKTITSKGKRLNLQALMVKRELALREQGRGYTAFGARLKPIDTLAPTGGATVDLFGRYHNALSDATLTLGADSSDVTLRFGGIGSGVRAELGDSLATPQGQTLVALAIERRTADMGVYIARQYAKGAAKAFRKQFPTTSD
jgi:hypothetical protein